MRVANLTHMHYGVSIMGLWDRLFGTVNRAEQVKFDVEHSVFRDRRFERAEELAESGRADEAVVTGIRRRLNDSTTDTRVRLEWFSPEPRVGAIAWGMDLPLIVRLGSTVQVRTSGDKVTLDPDAMSSHSAAPRDPGRRSRTTPAPGIDDKAMDARVLSRLKKWTAETAVIESVDQTRALGMATQNWDIVVRRNDGSTATISRDEVPPYARWYVVPGAKIPVVLDPKNLSRAQGNWPQLAEERATAGGRWSDSVPEGSIAATELQTSNTAIPAASVGEQTERVSPDPGLNVEGVTIERWAQVEAALTAARVPPANHDAVATTDHGIPMGRWSDIKAEWNSRMKTDWRVGTAYGAAYEAALKQLKGS